MDYKVDYGIDAPDVLRRFALLGVVAVAAGLLCFCVPASLAPAGVMPAIGAACVGTGAWFFAIASLMVWGSKVGKLRLRDSMLAGIPWRGDEQVLDVGCGHGLMLIGAAGRLTTGRTVGIDIWQAEDQAGNSPRATLQNIRSQYVERQAVLIHADARDMCFADERFDVVLSSWALHNIYSASGRERALREMVRVLKPGGRLAIVDIRHGRQYEQILTSAGLEQVRRRGPHFLFFIPSHVVTAVKSAG